MATNEEQLNQIYDAQLAAQTEQLAADHEAANADLDAQKAKNQKAADANISAARAQAQRAAVNNAEYYNASGLSSGARAQARLAQENQLQADLTTLRTAQQEADAEVERQRGLLAQEYASAIRQAQADNDLARAQALYQEAKDADAKLLAKQEGAAQLLAQTGDYSAYGTLYGLTPEQITLLNNSYTEEKERSDKESAAQLLAQVGDYSRLGALYGLTAEEISKLNGSTVSSGNGGNSSGGGTVNNDGLSTTKVKQLQKVLGVSVDGLYGEKSAEAAGGLSATDAYKVYVEGFSDPNEAAKYLNSRGAMEDAFTESGTPMSSEGWNNLRWQYEKGYALTENEEAVVTRYNSYSEYLTDYVLYALVNYGN